ncbi:MAG: trypsin-like peptidase domain-containing protein [Gemmatimonadota bacterium]|nr:trypsin-like peptidase domain-containing protein [Gemmatimonadota bacterium]
MTDARNAGTHGALEAVVLHLTGPFRGIRQHLFSADIEVGTAEDADVRFPGSRAPQVARRHATIHRHPDGTFHLRAAEGESLFVNGAAVDEAYLASGDVLALGEGGPLLRFLILRDAPEDYKSLGEALRDCVDCARHGSRNALGRAATILRTLPRDLVTQTSPSVRVLLGTLALLLVVAVTALAAFGIRLERRIAAEGRRVQAVEEAIRERSEALADPQLRARFEELAEALTERVGALEALSDAGRRIVRSAEPAVVFLQGAYGWTAEDGRPLRHVVGEEGRARIGPGGVPLTSLDGDGPPVASQFTGSAFLVREDGLLVTNRHVALPWTVDEAARTLAGRGLRPELRLLAYAPGIHEAFETSFVAASPTADVALLRAPGLASHADPLPLGDVAPGAGDEVLVLGYPAGINALLARSGPVFVDSLMRSRPDFWKVVEELAAAELIRPLASRGIVGQVTPASVVYDAETTRGGSGGPVLSLRGEVIAVTFGIMQDFGGSNLGVPIEEVRRLILDSAPLPAPEGALSPDAGSPPPGLREP